MSRDEARASVDKRYFGVYHGLVVKPDRSKKEPQPKAELGEVAITLPWYDDATVFPARVATLYAGKQFGSVWTPEHGTEVVVAFENGDLRSPVVLGCLHNGVDVPPTARDDHVDRKLLQTRKGHYLAFDDGPDQVGVELVTSAGHRIAIDDKGARLRVTFKDGPELTMTSDELKLTANRITIKAEAEVTVEAATIRLN